MLFFFKQKTAYEMRISDWSSDVCSSDLAVGAHDAVVTNLEADHLEHWGSEAALREAFERFVGSLPGAAVLCVDDPGAAALVAAAVHPITYGTAESAGYRIVDVAAEGTGVAFALHRSATRPPAAVPAPHSQRQSVVHGRGV